MANLEAVRDPQHTGGGCYSPAVHAGGLIYTAGMAPVDPETGELVLGTVTEQTHLVLKNLERVLHAAGSDLEHVVKATVHLSRIGQDWHEFDAAYRQHFTGVLPARTTVGSTLNGFDVEIDFVAVPADRD